MFRTYHVSGSKEVPRQAPQGPRQQGGRSTLVPSRSLLPPAAGPFPTVSSRCRQHTPVSDPQGRTGEAKPQQRRERRKVTGRRGSGGGQEAGRSHESTRGDRCGVFPSPVRGAGHAWWGTGMPHIGHPSAFARAAVPCKLQARGDPVSSKAIGAIFPTGSDDG